MRLITGTMAVMVLVLAAGATWAAQMKAVDFLCPVDNTRFTLPVLVQLDASAGVDSDFCKHTRGISSFPYLLVTCPRCNYTALRQKFADPVKPEVADKILGALATSSHRGVENPFTEIPLWERARMGERCAEIKGEPAGERVEFHLLTVYELRVEATRMVDRLYQFRDPIDTERVMGMMQRVMLDEKDKGEQAAMKLHLAMIAERAGLTRERDDWLTKAKVDPTLSEASKRELERFTKLVGLERTFQEEMVKVMEEALKDQTVPADQRNFLRYREADTLRRLGKMKEALVEFKVVREAMAQTGPIRDLCDHYIKMLEGPAVTGK